MNMTYPMAVAIMTGALLFAGCGKSRNQQEQGPPPMEMRGVKVDLPKLQQILPADKPELKAAVSRVTMALRYAQFANAITELEKLSTADLTEPQKKVVTNVLGQVKEMMAKNP